MGFIAEKISPNAVGSPLGFRRMAASTASCGAPRTGPAASTGVLILGRIMVDFRQILAIETPSCPLPSSASQAHAAHEERRLNLPLPAKPSLLDAHVLHV